VASYDIGEFVRHYPRGKRWFHCFIPFPLFL
jgi:hypothetical protein